MAFELSPMLQDRLTDYLDYQLQISFGRFMSAYTALQIVGIKPVVQRLGDTDRVVNVIKSSKGKINDVRF